MITKTAACFGLAVAASVALSSNAFAAAHKAAPIKQAVVNGKTQLVNAKGHTLYTFDKDKAGVSNCNGKCAVKWPPLKAKKAGMKMGAYSVIKRQNGSLQWAYKGKPLYTWFKDTKAGQNTGDGVKGVWHTARP